MKTLSEKTCGDNNTAGTYTSFARFVQHPSPSKGKAGGGGARAGAYYTSIFVLEVSSPYADESFYVHRVSGSEERLVTTQVPVHIELSKGVNNTASFLFFTSHEELQSLFLNFSPVDKEKSELEKLEVTMETHLTGRSVYG